MTKLRAFLARHRRVALDTNVLVYHLEAHPAYKEATNTVMKWVEADGHSAVVSTIAMAELLVVPYRLGDEDRVNRFFATLTTYPHLEWVAPDLLIVDGAARLRARHKLTTPDALIAATALAAGATGLVTNDTALTRVAGIEVAVLDALTPP